jgi:hypothetical protein
MASGFKMCRENYPKSFETCLEIVIDNRGAFVPQNAINDIPAEMSRRPPAPRRWLVCRPGYSLGEVTGRATLLDIGRGSPNTIDSWDYFRQTPMFAGILLDSRTIVHALIETGVVPIRFLVTCALLTGCPLSIP